MHFGYRKSIAQDEGYIVLSAIFKLNSDKSKGEIKSKMDDFLKEELTLNSLWICLQQVRLSGGLKLLAGKLIDNGNDLRGLRHGGAMVSEKHCGFIVNFDNATARDVKELIETVQKVVL